VGLMSRGGAEQPAGGQSMRQRIGSRTPRLIVLVFFLALAFLFFSLGWLTSDAWIGGRGDEILESWYMGWIPWAITHGHNPLISTYMDYPAGLNTMWNTSVPVLSLVGAPVLWLFGPRIEYHMWLTLGVALSAYFAYLFAQRRIRLVPAVVAGLIYGFSPFVLAQSAGHLHESFAVTPPLFLMLFDDLLVRRTRSPRRSGLYLGALGATQLLIGEEVLATLLIVTTIALIVLAILARDRIRDGLRRLLAAASMAVPVGLLLTAYPLYIQFAGPQSIRGVIQPPNIYVTDLLNLFVPNSEYFTPHRAAQIAAHWTGNSTEQSTYLSVPGLMMVGGVVVALWRRRIAVFFAVMMAAVLLLSLGPHLHIDGKDTGIALPWQVIDHVPVLQNILPARFALYLFLFAGLIVAHGVDATINVKGRRVVSTAAWAFTAVTLAALLPVMPAPVKLHQVPSFFTSNDIRLIPSGSIVLVAPWSDGTFTEATGTNTAPMVWQNVSQFRYGMPSGYAIAVLPPATNDFDAIMNAIWLHGYVANGSDPSLRAAILDRLRNWRVAAVVVGPMTHRADMVAFFTAILGRPGRDVGGVTIWTKPIG
jgi:hypothetical protein